VRAHRQGFDVTAHARNVPAGELAAHVLYDRPLCGGVGGGWSPRLGWRRAWSKAIAIAWRLLYPSDINWRTFAEIARFDDPCWSGTGHLLGRRALE